MTDRQQPHPKRCETCKHYQTRFEYGNKKICTLIKEKAPTSYQIGIPFNIDIVGCASHSSATEPAEWSLEEIVSGIQGAFDRGVIAGKKAAREEVLDELAEPTIRASEEAEQNGDYVSQTCYEDVLKWIAAIRQQEGKP
jgi:hypothetical protein